jgi:hypothetical protein
MTTRNLLAATALATALIGFAPASHAQNAAPKYFFEGDIVRSGVCVLNNQFKRGERVAFRVRVSDPKGAAADDKRLKTLVVELSDGTKLPMKYSVHRNTDSFWSISWTVPDNYATGTLTYKVTATDTDNQSQSWSPFNIAPSQLTVIE